jgi:formylglycine-generating enzyme required for sulfatase activity
MASINEGIAHSVTSLSVGYSSLTLLTAMALPSLLLAVACGRNRTDEPSSSGGSGAETTGGGGTSQGSGGGDGAGGYDYDDTPLEPTAACVHPDVVENGEGDFFRIEPGCFIMGAPPGEFGRGLVDSDQVQVTLTHPFWIGRTEVTRAQWEKSGLAVPVLEQLNGERECLEPDCPQGNADFYDMLHYANRLSELEGWSPCYLFEGEGCTGDYFEGTLSCPQVKINAKNPYECEGYRLPMEAEWEYAARGGTKTAFPTGDITPQRDSGCYFDAAIDAIGWYCMNSPDQAQRVALKPPNAWGLHDMHGNLNERVNDLYGPSGYLIGPYGAGSGPLVDPPGVENQPDDLTQTQVRRAVRGGTHLFEALSANVSRRSNLPDYGSASNLGFRVVRTIQ